jgi:hypothetical protein
MASRRRKAATEALLVHERFVGAVWDACYQDRSIMEALNAVNLPVVGTTIDFLGVPATAIFQLPNVITEPPFDLGEAYARHAVEMVTAKVALLLPAKFLSQPTSKQLFAETPLVRVYFLTDRAIYREPAMTWLVWEKGNYEPPRVLFI